MKLEVTGTPLWDRADPVNAGIQAVELVSGQAGVLARRIRYIEPVSGLEYVFLTNEITLRPGLIAFLYKLRWDVEKVFDQLKNKLGEQQCRSRHRHHCATLHLFRTGVDPSIFANWLGHANLNTTNRVCCAWNRVLASESGPKTP